MRGWTLVLLVAVMTLFPLSGNSMQEFFGAGPMPYSPDWPDGLRELINGDGRVAGVLGFADCWTYYAGDTARLNALLKEYAGAPDTRLDIVLHPGRRTLNIAKYDKTDRVINVDWALRISEHLPGRPDESAFEGKKVLASLDVWLGGQIAEPGSPEAEAAAFYFQPRDWLGT